MQEYSPFSGGAAGSMGTAGQGRVMAKVSDLASRWSVIVSLALIPLLYIPGTIDILDLPKQAALVAVTIVALLAWLGKMIVHRKVEFRRSIVNLLVLVWVVVYGLSAWFSKSQYVSFVGDFGQQKAGFVTVVCFALLYFVAINVLKGASDVKKAVWALAIGAGGALLFAYLQAFGLRLLPGTASTSAAFNLIGTSNALGLLGAALASLAMGALLEHEKGKSGMARQIVLGVAAALAVLFVASLSFWALWVSLLAGAAIVVAYGMIKTDRVPRVTMLSIPMAAVVISILFSFLRFPVNFGLPAEVMPSIKASWSISREALASSPLFGSGPGTFLYDYTQFHSRDLNLTLFWNVQFDRSASRLLTMLATTGILSTAAFLILVIFVAVTVGMRLARGQEDWLTTLGIFAAWVALLVGKVLYSSNLTLEFVFWMLTALLVVLEWRGWQEARFDNSPRAALLSSFLFIVAVIFSIAGLYLEGQRYVAERHYAKGVTASLQKEEDLTKAAERLTRAAQLNPRNDLYFRSLSQALALQATVAAQKAGGRPDEATARQILTYAANAVNAGKRATDLNPSNVQNWSSLANLYRDLGTSTPGATEAAESAYTKASELQPNSPIYRAELGKIYLARAEAATAQVPRDAKEEQKAAAKAQISDLIFKATEQLNKAVELKQDYAPAHYWLAVSLERQGKTKEALAKLESVRNYNPNDLGVGFQLAILYYQNNERAKAIAELERIISLNPQYANARWYLSAMYEEENKMDLAIAQIEEVLKTNPDNESVKKRLEELKGAKSGIAPSSEGLPEPVDNAPVQP